MTGGTAEPPHFAYTDDDLENIWDPPDQVPLQEPAPRLELITAAELVERVEGASSPQFLIQGVWPADAYGVLAAEHKAGKTWLMLDLAVSVTSDTSWLGRFSIERAGPVIVFLGEGGERKMHRRLEAVCRSRGLDLASLSLILCFRTPHLSADRHSPDLLEFEEALAKHEPVLVIIDPLYLAASGVNAANLFEMGGVLASVQHLCQAANCALVITHHWKKGGEGTGSDRMSGVGPAEWGRVLVNVHASRKSTDPQTTASTAVLTIAFEGDEIPDTTVRLERRVWTDDPDDLASPMYYEVRPAGDAESESEAADLRRLVLSVLPPPSAEGLKPAEVVANLRQLGHKLGLRAVQEKLRRLAETGEAHRSGHPNTGYRYRLAADQDARLWMVDDE